MRSIKMKPLRRQKEEQYEQIISGLYQESEAHTRMIRDMAVRLASLEDILFKNIEGFSPEAHSFNMLRLQDRARGMTPETDVQRGDLIRVDVRFRLDSQEESETENAVGRVEIQEVGSGGQFSPDFEDKLLGMRVGEEVSFSFLESRLDPRTPVKFQVTVLTISRKNQESINES